MTRLADVVPGIIVHTGEMTVRVVSQHPHQYITKVVDITTEEIYNLHPIQECEMAHSLGCITDPTDYDLN